MRFPLTFSYGFFLGSIREESQTGSRVKEDHREDIEDIEEKGRDWGMPALVRGLVESHI